MKNMALALAGLASALCMVGCPEDSCLHTLTCEHPDPNGGSAGMGGGGGPNNLLELGQQCGSASEACESGYCVDGVCCDSACAGICEVCDLTANPGLCTAEPAGNDSADECVGAATCNGEKACVYGELLWNKKFVSSLSSSVRDIAIDSAGNAVIVGSFNGTLDLGGAVLSSSDVEIFVAKLGPDGNVLWSESYGSGPQPQIAYVVDVDASDNITVAGLFSGSLTFGGATFTNVDNPYDLFVAKLTAEGSHMWSKSFSVQSGLLLVNDLVVTAAGDTLFTGSATSQMSFGGQTLPVAGASDAYLVKLDGSGNHVWSRMYGSTGNDAGIGVDIIDNDDVVWTGNFQGTITVGGPNLVATGADIFLARFQPNGVHEWSTRFGHGSAAVRSLTASNNRILIGGEFLNAISFGGRELTAAGSQDAFLALFTGSGAHEWSDRFGSAAYDSVLNVESDSMGMLVVSGITAGSVDLGGGELISTEEADPFIGKLEPTGEHVWSKIFGTVSEMETQALELGPGDVVFLGGEYDGALGFGDGDPVVSGLNDAFIAAFGP